MNTPSRILNVDDDMDSCEMVLLMLDMADGDYQEQALEAGCNKVIGKPIDFENALQIISGYLPKGKDF